MHTLSKSELGIRSGCFLCGSGVRKVRISQTVRGDSYKGTMLAWPKARPENVVSIELSVEKETNMKDIIEDGRNHILNEKKEAEP